MGEQGRQEWEKSSRDGGEDGWVGESSEGTDYCFDGDLKLLEGFKQSNEVVFYKLLWLLYENNL